MPLDPVLAQGVTPINFAGPDPATKMNQLAMMMKMQGLQSEGQLNALKLTEAQREMADVEAMRDAIRKGANFRDPKVAAQFGPKGFAMNKAMVESDNAELENKTKIAAAGRDIWLGINNQATYEAKLPELEALSPGSTRNLPKMFTPELKAENVMDVKAFLDQYKPQTELSKLIAARDSLPLGHPNRATYDAAIDKQTRFAPTDNAPVDRKKIAQTVSDAAGNTRFFNAYGVEITPTSGAGAPTKVQGKPSATFEKTTAQRKQLALDLDRAITELSAAAEDGGLIDQSTGSGLGQLADTAAGAIGQATPGALAISELQPVADLVLKLVPRFEGPQSDKDTQSYEKAAGQIANGNLPTAIRKTAARKIVRLMTERKGQFVSRAMADEGTSAQPENDSVSKADALLQKYPGE